MIKQIDCTYLSPNKTIEEILITRKEARRTVYVYNYKGISFRFSSIDNINSFIKNGGEAEKHFLTEGELDKYLVKIIP
jgi:hypothetical protein